MASYLKAKVVGQDGAVKGQGTGRFQAPILPFSPITEPDAVADGCGVACVACSDSPGLEGRRGIRGRSGARYGNFSGQTSVWRFQ